MAKPKNQWAHELSGLLSKAGYTVMGYGTESKPVRSDKAKEEDGEYRTFITIQVLPPEN